MSPDDHYADLKRVIAAAGGKDDLKLWIQFHFYLLPVAIAGLYQITLWYGKQIVPPVLPGF